MKLQLKNINFSYQKQSKFLENINLSFKPGIVGLVGPNGAGKSTLIKLITQSIKAQSGEMYYDEILISKKDFVKDLGYMPQSLDGFSKFKTEQFLYYIASLKGMSKEDAKLKILDLIKILELDSFLHMKMEQLSGGMRQRVLFAQAILNDPKVLILDEPTAGLDPYERIKLRNIISRYSDDKIVLIATHVMQDIEAIAQSLIFIKKGSIEYDGDVQRCLNSFKVEEKVIDRDELDTYQDTYKVSRIHPIDNQYRIRYLSENGSLNADLDDAYLHFLVD